MKNTNKIDYLLQHITSLLTRDSDQILLEQMGIGYSQYKILRVVNSDAPVKQKYIANVLGQTEASISRQVNILIDKSLVLRQLDPRNKRVKLIKITIKGKNLTDAAIKVLDKFEESTLGSLNNKDQLDMLKLLKSIHSKTCAVEHTLDPDYLTYITEN